MADSSYQPLVYRKQGATEIVVGDNGKIDFGSDSDYYAYCDGTDLFIKTLAGQVGLQIAADGAVKRGGSYASPNTNTSTYQFKTYGLDTTNGGASVITFMLLRGTGSTALYGDTVLIESNSTGADYPGELQGAQFHVGLGAAAKLATRPGGAGAGMVGAWLKVYSAADSVVDSGAYSAAVWLDNQHSANSYSGTEYTIFATTGGTVPDAFIGMKTSSGGWASFITVESGGAGAMLLDTDQSLSTQAGALVVVTPAGTRYLPLYSS